jgi:GNAT superfamily N-acetyltransferase
VNLPDGFSDVPAGRIAAIVTSLEMFSPPPRLPDVANLSWTLRAVAQPAVVWYRDLFHRIGDDWLWFSRHQLSDERLRAVIHDPRVVIHALEAGGRDEGLLELDFRADDECELAFLGLTRTMLGRGAGRWMMNRAIELAWSRPIKRLWLHTCTLDHPDAVSFYVRSGFVPFRRQVEIAVDPRAAGLVPSTAAPQIPRI